MAFPNMGMPFLFYKKFYSFITLSTTVFPF